MGVKCALMCTRLLPVLQSVLHKTAEALSTHAQDTLACPLARMCSNPPLSPSPLAKRLPT